MSYRFLIYISYSYSIPIGEPLYKELKNRGVQVFWFADESDGKQGLESIQYCLKEIEEVIEYKPHIVLCATNEVPDFITGIKVQLFHGFNAEKRPENNSFSHFRIRGFFDLYCTQGPNTTKEFKKLEKIYGHFKVKETGWSKMDPLFPLPINDNLERKPTILIASTFTERLSLAYDDQVYNEILRLSQLGNYNFKMVLHPKIPVPIREKWQNLDSEYFKFFNTTDLIPLFKESDIMFADTTSAIQEFLLQEKPVVTFNHTLPHNYLINITLPSEIEGAFKRAFNPDQELIDNIRNYVLQLHPYFDGKSSQRVVDACINIVEGDLSSLKKKPLNLIRKFKIRKKLNHFTLRSYNHPQEALKNA